MNIKTYYLIIIGLALIGLVNFIAGDFIGHFAYDFPLYYSDLLFNCIVFGVVMLMAWHRKFMSSILLFCLNLYSYWVGYSWGMTGFTLSNTKLQPFFSAWISLLTMAFCIFGGVYFFFKRSSKG